MEVLHGVGLSVRQGEFVSILGPNGAGKSTLLRTIFGLCRITSGSILFRDYEISRMKPQQILSLGAPYVPQGRCNFPLMTVTENLEMAAFTRRDTERLIKDFQYVYDLFPILQARKKQLAGSLSGGEQQVLEMAMALLRRPKLLLIDEPSMGLSPQTINWVFGEIQRLHREGVTILLVEQNTRKAMEVANRTVVMRLGRIIWDGPTNIITQQELAKMFLTGELPYMGRI